MKISLTKKDLKTIKLMYDMLMGYTEDNYKFWNRPKNSKFIDSINLLSKKIDKRLKWKNQN